MNPYAFLELHRETVMDWLRRMYKYAKTDEQRDDTTRVVDVLSAQDFIIQELQRENRTLRADLRKAQQQLNNVPDRYRYPHTLSNQYRR